MTENNPNANNNSSCSGCGLLICAIVLFLLFCKGVMGLPTAIIIFIVCLFVALLFFNSSTDNDTDNRQTANDSGAGTITFTVQTVSSPGGEDNSRQLADGISKEYFNAINSYIDNFFKLADELAADARFAEDCHHLDGVEIEITDGQTIGATNPREFRGKLRVLMLTDLIRNFENAGHPLNLQEKEQFATLLFQVRMFGSAGIGYDYVPVYYNESRLSRFENLARQLLAIPEPEQKFYVYMLLSDYDDEKAKKYLVMLYRVIWLASRCDGVVSEQESQWMNNIMKLENSSSNGNVRVSAGETAEAETGMPVDETAGRRQQQDSIAELNGLVGLSSVKKDVIALANLIRIQKKREEKGMKTKRPSFHCVFTGNPGTGKTTVARILAGIYRELGILKKGQLIETDRSGLVAEYVGQTAVKTNKIIDKAMDGVLFIDEAYTLVNAGKEDYGHEAIATLLKRMEDDRDRLVVILAGYTQEMKEFIDSNPGLQSRFNRYIFFPDYNEDELMQIFELNLKKYEYKLTAGAEEKLEHLFADAIAVKDQNFGNARYVRNVFDKTIENQASRLASVTNLSEETLSEITAEDIP